MWMYPNDNVGSPVGVTRIKITTFALGLISFIFYMISDFTNRLFINTLVLFLVLSIISLFVSMALKDLKRKKGIKICDMILHFVAAVLVFLASVVLLDRVTNTSTAIWQGVLGEERYPPDSPERVEWGVQSWPALFSGIFAFCQSQFHAAVLIVSWLKFGVPSQSQPRTIHYT